MSPETERIFSEVADLPPAAREQYYESQQVDEAVRDNVESLLAHDVGATGFLEGSIAALAEAALARMTGRRCGPYELLELIGRGGMGAVYRACRRDGEVEQEVAIKVLRHGSTDANIEDRFLQERQILANLSHPNIARMLDAGRTAEGQPYLVMEFVRGIAIDEYCRGASLRDRIALFLPVCEAVAHAHRNLVVHRDLKPANILVTADGHPKLLDFGIAKIMAPDMSVTRLEDRALTPEYGSPEQVTHAPTTTATDIYSLGALLYSLLTGASPHRFESRTPEEVTDVICRREAPPASRFEPACRGDLDAILRKALRKEPEERYATVEQFADDLRSYLSWRPVRVRGDEWLYRLRRFARRHWVTVMAVTLAFAGLTGGLLVAHREQAIAERRFRQVRDLAERLFDIDQEVRPLPGSTQARQEIVATSLEYLDRLSKEASDDSGLMVELAAAYTKTASILGRRGLPNLGRYEDALHALEKADTLLRQVLARDPGDRAALRGLVNNGMELADVRQRLKSGKEAQEKALAVARDTDRMLSGHVPDVAELRLAVGAYSRISTILLNETRVADARLFIEKALVRQRRLTELVHTPGAQFGLAGTLRMYGTQLRYEGDLERAVKNLEEGLHIVEQFPEDVHTLTERSTVLYYLGVTLGEVEGLSLGRSEAGAKALTESLAICRRLVAADPKDMNSRIDLAQAATKAGRILARRDPVKALALFDEGIAVLSAAPAGEQSRDEYLIRLWCDSTSALNALHRYGESRRRIALAIGALRAADRFPFEATTPTSEEDVLLRAQAETEAAEGNLAKAIEIREGAVRMYRRDKSFIEADLQHAFGLANQWARLAELNRLAGRREAARENEARRAALWQSWLANDAANAFVRGQLAAVERE